MIGKVRFSYWCDTTDMLANPFTKHEPWNEQLNWLLTHGELFFKLELKRRSCIKFQEYSENDIDSLQLDEKTQTSNIPKLGFSRSAGE